MAERKFTIAVCKAGPVKNLGKCANQSLTWPELIKKLSNPLTDDVTMAQFLAESTSAQGVRKNKRGAFVGGAFDGDRRNSIGLQFRSIVTLDVDTHADDLWSDLELLGTIPALKGTAYQVHTTRKHTPEKPRLRIVVPLVRDVEPFDYFRLVGGLSKILDSSMLTVSEESYRAPQVMFFPTVCKGAEFFTVAVDGDLLDPDAILARYPKDQPHTWPHHPEADPKQVTRARMTHPEEKKLVAPIVTALHRAFEPREFIEEFLSDFYEPAEGRFRRIGSEGPPSVRVYDEAFVHSDHASSDKAYGQHNTFDLGRIHLFGDLDDDFDTASTSPIEWPSYKAMTEWALDIPEVAEHMGEIDEEVQAERDEELTDFLDELEDLDPEEDDLVGGSDEDDDLIGVPKAKKEKSPAGDEVVKRTRQLLEDAESLSAVDKIATKCRSISPKALPAELRELLVAHVQAAFARHGEKLSKSAARGMLAYKASISAAELLGKKGEWLKDLARTKDGGVQGSLTNIRLILANDPMFKGCIAFNEFTGELVARKWIGSEAIAGAPVFPVRDRINGETWTDSMDNAVRFVLASVPTTEGNGGYGLTVSDRDLMSAIDLVGKDNAFHPVKEYLEKLKWDGKPRLAKLFVSYLGVENSAYAREVPVLTMVAAVARIYEPGHKWDQVPILEGKQGLRKSTFVRTLAADWFSELTTDFTDTRKAVESMTGSWILEIPELDSFSRKEITAIKNFFSMQGEKVRMAYARRTVTVPRQCIFIGSTNEDDYLSDPTGNRRFWPVICAFAEINIDKLRKEIKQIWAEAVAVYRDMRAGNPKAAYLPLLLSPEALKTAVALQESRRVQTVEDGLAGLIEQWLDEPKPLSWFNRGSGDSLANLLPDDEEAEDGETRLVDRTCAHEIAVEVLGKNASELSRGMSNEIVGALKRIKGWEKGPRVRTKLFGQQQTYVRK